MPNPNRPILHYRMATSQLVIGAYKPRTGRTGQCMNHAPAILDTPALIYSTRRVLVIDFADILLNGAPLRLCNTLKYLGITFDVKRKLRVSMASKRIKF